MLSKIQIARLIFKAYEINAENSRYKLCVDYSKCLGDHHVLFYVIDESKPFEEGGNRLVQNITVNDKYTGMTIHGRATGGWCGVAAALAEMEKWRESNGAERAV